MAYSAGFSPHPKISYVGASPTGVASEAEYLEIGLARRVDPQAVRRELDAALPPGLDITEAVEAGPGSLAERMHAARWRIEFDAPAPEVAAALAALLATSQALVERRTKDGRKLVDARAAILAATVVDPGNGPEGHQRAIMDAVVRLTTPAIRPDDVLAALAAVGGLARTVPARAVRLAQGPLDGSGGVSDPLALDRAMGVGPVGTGVREDATQLDEANS